MDISDILFEDMVCAELDVLGKRQAFEEMARFIAQKKGLDQNSVFEAIWERENLGSTGYGNGVAFPHARMSGVNEVITAFFRLAHKIPFEAIDNEDVDLIACVISPENRGEDHLLALSLFSRVFKNEDVSTKIRNVKSVREIYGILQQI